MRGVLTSVRYSLSIYIYMSLSYKEILFVFVIQNFMLNSVLVDFFVNNCYIYLQFLSVNCFHTNFSTLNLDNKISVVQNDDILVNCVNM